MKKLKWRRWRAASTHQPRYAAVIPVASCFSQILSLVDRKDFARALREYEAEKYVKGFSCWTQFVAMLFCQTAGANSLRKICRGLATAMGKLVHLWPQGGSEALHACVCERTSAVGGLSGGVPKPA